jgi:uncharacterized protein involved in outer membrane biogenesis
VLTAARTEIVMDDISILNLQLGLSSVTLEQPYLRVVRHKDGSLNWMHYFGPGDAPPALPANATDERALAARTQPSLSRGKRERHGGRPPTASTNTTIAVETGNASMSEVPEIDNATAARRDTARTLLLQAPKIRLTDGRILFTDEAAPSPRNSAP